MKKDGKILQFGSGNICLFCGQQKQTKYEEYQAYFECDCSDAKKEREIEAQIEKLKQQMPREKYEVIQQQVLYKVRD